MFKTKRTEHRSLITISTITCIVWTGLVAISLVWNISQRREETRVLATKEAISHFEKDTAFRYWASSHGGVYVPTDERTPPNVNLAHIPDRDITTPSGKMLTLMNPAYMLRQLMTEYEQKYGIKGKITAYPDKLLNPINMPDAWELAALKAFDQGKREAFEFTDINGQPYLRLMRPMHVEESCLKCHAFQGYKVGDLRGGVGVAVPLDSYLSSEKIQVFNLSLSHSAIWLFGLGGILAMTRRAHINLVHRLENEEQLKQAKAMAEAASHTKSMFLANMSHELRTPLNAIIGFSQMMSQQMLGELPPAYLEYAKLIDTSGHHLLETINQILDLSKIEAGMMELEEEEIYMGDQVEDVITLLKHAAESKSVTLLNHTHELHAMWVDPIRIKQALFNVIGNAIKFTEHGEVIITSRCDEKGHRIIVTDTGIGMSEDELKIALEPFGQAQSHAYTRRIEGTGLGLSLTQHIMHLHGGELRVHSTQGVGTEVILFFPKSREAQAHHKHDAE